MPLCVCIDVFVMEAAKITGGLMCGLHCHFCRARWVALVLIRPHLIIVAHNHHLQIISDHVNVREPCTRVQCQFENNGGTKKDPCNAARLAKWQAVQDRLPRTMAMFRQVPDYHGLVDFLAAKECALTDGSGLMIPPRFLEDEELRLICPPCLFVARMAILLEQLSPPDFIVVQPKGEKMGGQRWPSVAGFSLAGDQPSNQAVARLLCSTKQKQQPGDLYRQPRDLIALFSIAGCWLTQQKHSLRVNR